MSEDLKESFDKMFHLLTEAEAGRYSLAEVKSCLVSLRELLGRHWEPDGAERALHNLWHAENDLQTVRFGMVRRHLTAARNAVMTPS